MIRIKILQVSLSLSILFIVIGTVDLRIFSLVPLYLTYLSIIAVIIGFIDLYYVFHEVVIAIKIGVLLAVIAILSSIQPAHFTAILQFGYSIPLDLADISLIFGFIIFPLVYILSFSSHYLLNKNEL